MSLPHIVTITAALLTAVPATAQTIDTPPAPIPPSEAIAQALTRIGTFTCTNDLPKDANRRRSSVARAEWKTDAAIAPAPSPANDGRITVRSFRQGYPYPEGLKDRTPQEVERLMAGWLGRRSSLGFDPKAVTASLSTSGISYGMVDGASGVCATILTVNISCKVTEYRGTDADLCISGRQEWFPGDVTKSSFATILYAPSNMQAELDAVVRLINAS